MSYICRNISMDQKSWADDSFKSQTPTVEVGCKYSILNSTILLRYVYGNLATVTSRSTSLCPYSCKL